MRKEINT